MSNRLRQVDWTLVIVPLLLLFLGVVVIYTVTFPTVQFDLARSQIIYAILGLAVAIFLTFIDYRSWQSLSGFGYIIGIALLIAVFFLGSRQFGASRWIDLGFFHLQPSELFKLILVIVLARLLSTWSDLMTIRRLIYLLIVAAIPIGLVLNQPDLGTASVLIVITVGMLVFAKLPWRWWAAMVVIAAVLAPLAYSQLHDYQKTRVKTFLAPEQDLSGSGYNVRQAAIAIGSGGLFGQGLGQGSQSQLNFLPVAHTDFIFAGLAEATGLLGSLILLTLYLVLIARIFRVAELAKDQFGMYIALGIAIMYAYQVFVNIGMNIGILPVTGITLPFVSFGGTSLLVSAAALGLLQSVYVRHKKITF